MRYLLAITVFMVFCCQAFSDQTSDTLRRDINKIKLSQLSYSSVTQTKLNSKLAKTTFNSYTSIDRVTVAHFTSYSTNRQADLSLKVPATRTVNGHALSANITVTASDVGNSTAQWNADKIQGVTVDSAGPASGDFLRYSGSSWLHVALVSGDIPNNAANTTGSAATLTTARTINGTSFNGSANITTPITGSSDYSSGTWTPTFSGLTVVNGTGGATYAGTYRVHGDMVWWEVKITTTGTATTASSATGTSFDLPPGLIPTQYNVCAAANIFSGAGYGTGLLTFTGGSGYCFPPTWAATNNNIIISGWYRK